MGPGRRTISYYAAAIVMVAAFCAGCASIGSPDGGRYDDDPPVFKGSNPKRNALNVKSRTITLDFDEIVRIENAAEKVVVSPPMLEQPDIQVLNKRIQIKLKDSLVANTTYSIDFADAIVDNNEGNPLGDFCFSFSTGDALDTMEISGYVLDASNLEPIKGIMVGAYSDDSDSSFVTRPFERVSRTDSYGHFVMRGMANGRYRVYALSDMDQNFYFSQKSEQIAWMDSCITTSSKIDYRTDTVFDAKGEVDTVMTVPYVRYLPDDIVLLAFKEKPVQQYIANRSRKSHEKFEIVFAIPLDTLPVVRGLNFDEKDAFYVEHNADNDTLTYWMSDTLVYYMDTLKLSLSYPVLDSMGLVVTHIDTLSMVPPKSRAQVLKDLARKAENEAEEREKELRKLEKQGDSLALARFLEPKITYLNARLNVNGMMDIDQVVALNFDEPVLPFEPDSTVHVFHIVDSLMEEMPIVMVQDSVNLRKYNLYAEWRPEENYQIVVDSAEISGIYGLSNNKISANVQVKPLNEYSTFIVNVTDPKPTYLLQLFTGKDHVVRSSHLENGSAAFFFLKPDKYCLRILNDLNGNGKWDPGEYAKGTQAEEVWYMNKVFDLKANWDHETEPWNLTSAPLTEQKPDAAKSASNDNKKERVSKNIERDEKIAQQQSYKLKKKAERQEKREQRQAKRHQ